MAHLLILSRQIKRILLIPFVGSAYLGFALGGALLGYFVMPCLHLWPGSTTRKHQRCQSLVGWAFIVFHWYLYWIGVLGYRPPVKIVRDRIRATLDDAQRRGLPRATMVVANHPTLIDTMAIMASFPHLVVVAKPNVFRFPLLRPLFFFCGHASASPELGGEAVLADQLMARLARGESVLLFPEATRSPDHGLRRFRRGPFEIALRARVPIQPLVIETRPGLLKGGLSWYDFPPEQTPYRLRALDPIFPDEPGEHPERSVAPVAARGRSHAAENRLHLADLQPKSAERRVGAGRRLAQHVFDQISIALRADVDA